MFCFIFIEIGHFFNKQVNLHSLWDTAMIERRISADFQSKPLLYLDYLVNEMKTHYAQNVSDWKNCSLPDESRFLACSTAWIQESAKIDCDTVYLDEDDQRITVQTGFTLGQTYFNTRMVILEQRLIQGGVRLAAVINKIADSSKNDTKPNGPCFDSMLLIMVILIQSVFILVLLSYTFLRRKPTTIIQPPPPVMNEKKAYLVMA